MKSLAKQILERRSDKAASSLARRPPSADDALRASNPLEPVYAARVAKMLAVTRAHFELERRAAGAVPAPCRAETPAILRWPPRRLPRAHAAGERPLAEPTHRPAKESSR